MQARDKSGRKGNRSISREGSIGGRPEPKEKGNGRADSLLRAADQTKSANKDLVNDAGPQADEDAEKPAKIEQVVQQSQNSETSLRHLFYLEYKRNFHDGSCNPVVYSRFGKSTYDSDEKFDTNNFNQLIRTCNLRKMIKAQEAAGCGAKGNERKYSEPLSFPTSDYYKPKGASDKTLVFESRFESGNL